MTLSVKTTLGELSGKTCGRHVEFLGIPFAAPPVGERRFCPPAPHEGWTGARPATEYGLSAPQGTHPVPGMAASGPRSEDCLYLNVFTPALDGGRRPVLFWIHGGGFTMGSGSEQLYHGGPLAEMGDVVVVSIHYRLGALGYLYLCGLGGEAWGATANAGQLDQVAALAWVRDNIAAFGGDPANVTIFGESAGAAAVATLLAMPAAKGLFHRAIMQSGAANGLGDGAAGTRLATRFLAELGVPPGDRAAVQAVSADAIVAAQLKVGAPGAGQGARGFGPIVDGKTLPRQPLAAVSDGFASGLPVLIGTNRDEVKLFNVTGRDRAPLDDAGLVGAVEASLPGAARVRAGALIEGFRASRAARGLPVSNHDLLDAIQSTLRFRAPAMRLAEAQRHHQANTFVYLFTYESPARHGALGSCHALEMPFVFGTLDAPTQDRFAGTGPKVERLSRNMMAAWLAFAKTGNPAHEGIGPWPAYDSAGRATMVFDRESRVENAPFEEERAAIDSVLP